ncbi:RE2, partial [Symbiodinium necroappetens]
VVHDIHYKLPEFDPKRWHSSCEWQGQRIVISYGFPLPQQKKMYMFDGTASACIGEEGKVVGVDVIYLPALNPRESFPAPNMVDWGTGFQMVERLKNVEADHSWRTFLRTWGRTFGIPEVLVADLGGEFRGKFAEVAAQAGALMRRTAARSPWQAGKTERAGAHFKHVYERARDATHVCSWEEIKSLLYEVESSRNRFGNRSGYSSMQRQIGHNLRLPGSLLSDDPLDPHLMVQSAGDEMTRLLELRKAAQEAYIRSQTETALSRAKNASNRVTIEFHPGDTVYAYRQPKERKRRHAMTPESHEGRKPCWVGPGLVLAVEKPSLWVSMKGELWKVSMEQCRHATSEEQVSKEMLAGEMEALREELGQRATKRTFRDMTGEATPEEDLPQQDLSSYPSAPQQLAGEPAAARPRLDDPGRVPIPDNEMDYSPDGEEQPHELPEGPEAQPPEARQFERRRTESEPEPIPTPRNPMDPMTARTVIRNEQLDGNFRGTPTYDAARRLAEHRPMSSPYFTETTKEDQISPWFYYEDGRWKQEYDCWEFVNRFTVFSNKPIKLENYMAQKPRGQGEVFEHEIKGEEWAEWRKTDSAEWKKVADTGAIRVLSLEESMKVRNGDQRHPIIPSRMVRRWKPAEQPGQPPTRKSRWCLRGDRDPDLLELDRHASTLTNTSFGVLLQVAANMKYKAAVGDLKNAFCQSLPLTRKKGALYASLPKGGIDGLHEEQLVEIIAGVYGLGDSPKLWRRTLREAILGLGYKESVLDPTVYFLQSPSKLEGAIAVEVDDLFTFGSEIHETKMKLLQQKFQFEKYEDVMQSKDGVGFNGRRIHQTENYEFKVDMHKFVTERLSPVQLSKGRRSEPKALANDSEINQMRAVIGALNWLSKEGRPDAAAAASLGQSTFPKPIVQDILDVNLAVKMLKEKPELTIRIRSIELSKLAWGVISDASFGNAHAGHSQGAYAVLAFDEKLKEGYRVPCSMISWRSGRIQKVVNSTLAAETQSLSKGLGELSWVVTLFNELTDVNFELVDWEKRLKDNRVLAMAPDTSSEGLKSSLCIIDAKEKYDGYLIHK